MSTLKTKAAQNQKKHIFTKQIKSDTSRHKKLTTIHNNNVAIFFLLELCIDK